MSLRINCVFLHFTYHQVFLSVVHKIDGVLDLMKYGRYYWDKNYTTTYRIFWSEMLNLNLIKSLGLTFICRLKLNDAQGNRQVHSMALAIVQPANQVSAA